MNIWYIHPYGGGPGIGRFHRPYALAKEWIAAGHKVQVFIARYHHLLERNVELAPEFDVSGVPYHALAARPYIGNGLGRIRNMAEFCWSLWRQGKAVAKRSGAPDAIIVSSPHPFAIYPAAALARRYKAKLVFEVRDLWPLSITAINGTSPRHPFVWLCAKAESFAASKADVFASLLSGVHLYLENNGMKPKNFLWVPNGIEEEAKAEPKPPTPQAQALIEKIAAWRKGGKAVIIHPGSMGPPNGLELFLRAIENFNMRHGADRFQALLLGDGSEKQRLAQIIQTRKLENVAILEKVSKHDALAIIDACQIGYTGGLPHDAVYQYGISFNKIADFAKYGLRIVMPFDAHDNPVRVFALGTVAKAATPEAIADAIQAELHHLEADPSRHISAAYRKAYSYKTIAANYIDALRH